MRKIFTTFILLSLISTSFSLQIEQNKVLETQNDIRGLSSNSKSVFITTENTVRKISPEDNWTKSPDGSPWSIDSKEEKIITGLKVGGSKSLVYSNEGEVIQTFKESFWVDQAEIIGREKDYFVSSSKSYLNIYTESGEKIFSEGSRMYTRYPSEQIGDFDNDGETEIIFGGGLNSETRAKSKDLSGELNWKTAWKQGTTITKPFKNYTLISWSNGISLRRPNGTLIWSKNVDDFTRPIVVGDHIVYSKNGKLKFLDEEGENVKSIDTGTLSNLIYMEDHGLIAGSKSDQTIFVDLKTGEVYEENVSGVEGFDTTDFDQDDESELVVKKDRSIDLVEIKRDKTSVDQETVLYGNDPESILKAISLNMTVFVGNETAVPGKYNNYTKAGKADFSNLTQNKKRYYTDSREKGTYLAPIAAKNNAVLTFEEDNSDRDFSNYSTEELQSMFIQEFEPHHLSVADLESDSGLLASYMAVKQGSVPIDNYNSVILRGEIQETFDRIGENRKTVFQGKYISLLDAPTVQKTDPVEEGILGDPEDGDSYRTDLEYGNLNSDKFLEAGVGRYPENISLSSRIFHRSQNRKLGDKATVASEYLSGNWPTILATGGGGLRYGSRMERVFEEENYQTTHLVEYRANPVKFLVSLTPVEITSFLGEVDGMSEIVEKFVSETAANALENSLIIIKVLNYTEQLMEMYFEFEWSTFKFDFDRGIERMKDLDIDPTSDSKGDIQKSVMKILYAFIWPDRHPNLNETSLEQNMRDSDILYYQGIGDKQKWVLPDNTTGYSGENKFEPEDIPEMNKTIVWDNSNLAANGEMKDVFLKNGASSYLGYSSVNYPAYSSLTGYNFFRHRKTLGNSLKASINQMKTTDYIYSPKTIHKTGIREKMFDSLRLYGNPEMPKDPVNSNQFETDRSCKENTCTLSISLETPQRVVEHEGRKTVSSNSTNYLLEPGVSITPLYSFSYRLPEGSEVVKKMEKLETEHHENLSFEKFQPITSGGKAFNVSSRNISIQKSNLTVQENRLSYTVAGYRENETVDRAEINITYETPVTLEAKSEGKNLKAEIHSERSFKGKLLYSIDGETGSRSIEVGEGENSFDIENLSYGQHNVELVLTEESDILARHEKKVQIGKPLEITGFSPDIRKGSTRTVTAVVSNPNSFPVEEEIAVETSGKLELGMLEKGSRDLELGPKQTKELEWRILGIETGNTSFRIGRENISTEVRRSRSSERTVAPELLVEKLSSPTSEVTVEVSNQNVKAVWETEKGSLTLTRNSSGSRSLLETSTFKTSSVSTPEQIVSTVETDQGYYIKKAGETRRSGSIENPERKIEILDREAEKLENYLNQRATSGFRIS